MPDAQREATKGGPATPRRAEKRKKVVSKRVIESSEEDELEDDDDECLLHISGWYPLSYPPCSP